MAVNSVAAHAAPQIAGAIRQAARSSGISFEYLLTTAQIESNLNPAAQAATSSAKGLYQFIEQTWLATMKAEGPALGLTHYADAITRSADGRYEVPDPAMRAAIMRLRTDPAASAAMAGAFTRANAEQLQGAIGRAPSEGELYIAHFLGPAGAGKLIGAAAAPTRLNAADMFPQAAAANRSIFYDGGGRARSAGEVYGKLTRRFETARAVSFAPGPRESLPAQAASPDTAGVTQAFAQANVGLPPPPQTRPLFQSMFTDPARRAVTQTVSSLWTPAKSAPATAQPSSAAAAARRFDLFSDGAPDTQKLFSNNG